jgi:putative DNA primase/helicase
MWTCLFQHGENFVSNIESLSRDEIRRRIELIAADNQHSAKFEAQASGPELITRRASEIPIEPIAWLWPGRIALGKLTLIAGEAGLGKSQISLAVAAAVTAGGDWPCGEGCAPRGNVIVLSAEDGASDTVVPRLMAAGANCQRVCLVTAVQDQRRRTFDLGADLTLLEREIARVGDVRLIIIDPISSYLGVKVDSHVNAAVRGVLEPISELAARLGIAIVAITHPPKGTGTAAINRFIGSIAFVAAARAAFMVTRDADDATRRLFLPVKNNLAPLGSGLAFRLEQRIVGDDGKGIVGSSVVWDAEPVTVTADQALQAADAQSSGDRTERTQAEEFLQEILADGPVAAAAVKQEAAAAGLSWATVRRAQNRLEIRPARRAESGDGLGGRGHWYWSLPTASTPLRCSPDSYDAHVSEVSTLEKIEHVRRTETVPDDYPELPACLRRAPPRDTKGHASALELPGGNLDDRISEGRQ